MTNPNIRYILSCDGSGMRGLITAVMLEQLEEKPQAKNPNTTLRGYFDLVAGTSIDWIIIVFRCV